MKYQLIALAEQLEAFAGDSTKEIIQESAVYVFIKRGAKLLVEGGLPMDLAEEAMMAVETGLEHNLHKEYPLEFQRVVEAYANLLIAIYWALVEDFVHPRVLFLRWAAQCEIKMTED